MVSIIDRPVGGAGPMSTTADDRVGRAADLLAAETGVDASVVVDFLEELAEALNNRQAFTQMALRIDPSNRLCESVATSMCRTSQVQRSVMVGPLKQAVRCVTAGGSKVDPAGVLEVVTALSTAVRATTPSTFQVTVDPGASSCTVAAGEAPVMLLRRADVARILSISPESLDKLSKRGRIASRKLPTGGVRYDVAAVEAFISSCEQRPMRAPRTEGSQP